MSTPRVSPIGAALDVEHMARTGDVRTSDDSIFQTPRYEWAEGCCSRCNSLTGWVHDTDGARLCVDCFLRTCGVCHVSMSQHQQCTGPCDCMTEEPIR